MNTIAQRIADFLKNFPPFSMLQKEQLDAICQAVDVLYVEPNTHIFKTEDPVEEAFYVVKDGAIGLYRNANKVLVDECDEGDIFGLRALMRQGTYKLSALALEESIVYKISASLLETNIIVNPEANKFLLKTFASNSLLLQEETWQQAGKTAQETLPDFNEEQSAQYSKNPINCPPETQIKEAAKLMTNNKVGSIIVTENGKPKGIITDKDLRIKIATGDVSIQEPVTSIMSQPVKTYPEHISVAEAQIAMLQHKITHLCITKDGTDASQLTGVLSEHDIIVIRENNASVLVKEIKRAKTVETLKTIRQRTEKLLVRYIDQNLPIAFVSKIITAINDSITTKTIDLALNKVPTEPPVKFAWLAIGSQGRQEQLLLTDQDNFLVFEDVSLEEYEITQQYFLNLATEITKCLNTIGFEYCPANMMASNPKWCLSVTEWKKQFNHWIVTPDEDNLMLCTIFFDFERIYGDTNLVHLLAESIFESIAAHDIFLNYLAINALKNPPPLSFFRNFLVENSGEHKDQFDIKARAMMPLVDAARLLVLSKNIKSHNSTIARYKKLMELEPQNKGVYEACLISIKDLLSYRTQQGLKHKDSGRFIDLQTLSKADKLELKSAFKAVKNVQELIQTRFKLAQFL